MASTARAEYEQALLKSLRHAVHGLRAPFACGGTLLPEQPVTLAFPDRTRIPVVRAHTTLEQERLLQPLVERCAPAPFGMGRKTRYDRAVRNALQIKAEGGAFSVLHFDPAAAGILEQVRRELAPHLSGPLTAELYNLNVYLVEGHFAPHKDTPRGSGMLGTLVVCLPSRFSNGAFVLKHQGVLETYDWAQAIREQAEPTRIHWAAFFGDVDHQIESVWGGLRVTLTYLLRCGDDAPPIRVRDREREPAGTLLEQSLGILLKDRRFLPRGGTLAFPCSHLYQRDAQFQRKQRPLSRQTVSALKGRDHEVAAVALAARLKVTLFPYIMETCGGEAWQLDRFPTARERAALSDRMGPEDLESAFAVQASSEDAPDFDVLWVDPPPSDAEPDMPAEIALKHLHACEYSATGYFGNEGSETDFYVYCALHVAIPPYGEGPRRRK